MDLTPAGQSEKQFVAHRMNKVCAFGTSEFWVGADRQLRAIQGSRRESGPWGGQRVDGTGSGATQAVCRAARARCRG